MGGTERHLRHVLPRLRDRGWSPRVLTLTRGGPLADPLIRAGVPVRLLASRWWRRIPHAGARRVIGLPQLLRALASDLRAFPDDATWALLPEAYVMAGVATVLARSPAPLLMSRRSLNRYQARARVTARLERHLKDRTTAFLANSEAVARDLRSEQIPESRIHVIRNGIDLSPFDELAVVPRLRARLGVPEGAVLAVCVANLIPYKGHLDLIDTMALLSGHTPSVHLLCAGDGPLRAALPAHARERGVAERVHWLGTRSDVPALLHASDVGVLVSHEEGFSNAILEYMAAGLPTIATDVGGNAEAVVDGVTGMLVPPADPARIADALAALAAAPRRREAMGEEGLARARAHFDIEVCVERYDALLSRLLEPGAVAAQRVGSRAAHGAGGA